MANNSAPEEVQQSKDSLMSSILFPQPKPPLPTLHRDDNDHDESPKQQSRKHTRFQLFEAGQLAPFPANLLSSLDPPFSITSSNYQFALKKRQQFHQYLDTTGFFGLVSKVIVQMYEKGEQHTNVNEYLHDHLTAELGHVQMKTQLEFLKSQKEDLQENVIILDKKNKYLRECLQVVIRARAKEDAERAAAEAKRREEEEAIAATVRLRQLELEKEAAAGRSKRGRNRGARSRRREEGSDENTAGADHGKNSMSSSGRKSATFGKHQDDSDTPPDHSEPEHDTKPKKSVVRKNSSSNNSTSSAGTGHKGKAKPSMDLNAIEEEPEVEEETEEEEDHGTAVAVAEESVPPHNEEVSAEADTENQKKHQRKSQKKKQSIKF